jgi:hypothetical protein
MVCSLKKIRIPYGVIEIGQHGEIEKMKEKPELSFFTNTGMYIVDIGIRRQPGDRDIIEKLNRLVKK